MTHQAIYRQWRPKKFSDVLGQDTVVATLKNQINSGYIAHAYIFSGMRGTGKTSTARILARALNCMTAPDSEPCNKCEICLSILNETMMDVVEIDAASNNGVDDIRQLRETIKYPPTQTKYKIYIIDEVHMLSQGAFNALLKTLEEPPEYAVFILATTEPQKIPATILSRCQRYDFKSISRELIVMHLDKICKSMDIVADQKALQLIADNSGGALRDAQSLLEQSISSVNENLSYGHVLKILGMTSESFFDNFITKIFDSDISGVLEFLEKFISDGGRIDTLIQRLLDYYRQMIFVKSNVNISEYNSVCIQFNDEFLKRVESVCIENILWSMEQLGNLSTQIKWISQPRIHFEMLLIKLMVPRVDKSIEAVFARLDKLEANYKVESNNQVDMNYVKQTQTSKEEEQNISLEKIDNHELESSNLIDISMIQEQWESILDEIKTHKIQVQAFLLEGNLYSLENNKLIIKFSPEYSFHANMLSESKNNAIIQKVLNKRFSTEFMIKCICEENCTDKNETDKALISDEDRVRDFLGEYSDSLKIK